MSILVCVLESFFRCLICNSVFVCCWGFWGVYVGGGRIISKQGFRITKCLVYKVCYMNVSFSVLKLLYGEIRECSKASSY